MQINHGDHCLLNMNRAQVELVMREWTGVSLRITGPTGRTRAGERQGWHVFIPILRDIAELQEEREAACRRVREEMDAMERAGAS